MKYCTKCGSPIADDSKFCSNCGAQQTAAYNQQPYYNQYNQHTATPQVNDYKSFGFALLGFFVPIVGLILYLVWKDETPLKAKSAGKGALVAAILWIILVALMIFLFIFVISHGDASDVFTIIEEAQSVSYII